MGKKKLKPALAAPAQPEGGAVWRFLTAGLLLAALGFFIARPINLANADIGRHLKNGELFFSSGIIPKTNLYSYTWPDYPFFNHHWGSGVVFYAVKKLAGFEGLSWFFIILSLATFWFFFRAAWKNSGFAVSAFCAAIAVPVIASRSEIRPEAFSYFFCSVYFWLLLNHSQGRLSPRALWWIPPLQLVWVNLHIYFLFGLFLPAVFLAEALLEKNLGRAKNLALILAAALAASACNPFGLAGLLYPLKIFQNYGYRLLENQSVWFIEKILHYPATKYFKIMFAVLAASWCYAAVAAFRGKKRFPAAVFVASVAPAALGWLALRNFTIAGYFSFAAAAINFGPLSEKLKHIGGKTVLVLTAAIFLALWRLEPAYWPAARAVGTGLLPGNEGAGEFLLREKIHGPIFNNYDSGGYLVYYLYPGQRVFVDNRPEAYPSSFFTDEYVPMQETREVWLRGDLKYRFNAIVFFRHDLTPWGQHFLIERVGDAAWAPVFVDAVNIIFLRRGGPDSAVIAKNELPREMFSVSSAH